MSKAEKRVTVWSLETEAAAVRVSIRDRLPRDHDDVRVQHLELVKSALKAVQQIRTSD